LAEAAGSAKSKTAVFWMAPAVPVSDDGLPPSVGSLLVSALAAAAGNRIEVAVADALDAGGAKAKVVGDRIRDNTSSLVAVFILLQR